jgi:hypothetical protein
VKWCGEDYFATRRGVTRVAYLLGPWVVKIPSLRSHDEGLKGVLWSLARGIVANQSEWDWSNYEDAQGICPARWSLLGGLVNVYPRALAIPQSRVIDFDAIPYRGPANPNNRNVGILNERVVWVNFDRNWDDGPPCKHVDAQRLR